MADIDGNFIFAVMPAEAYRGAGSRMINIRQEWPSLADGETFVRVMIHERDAEALCEQIMAAASEARKA
jgi:hypothetical protein